MEQTTGLPALDPAHGRVRAYLRHAPLTEAQRLHLAVEVLGRLEADGQQGATAIPRAMELLRELMAALPARPAFPECLPVVRRHMTPEEMDRRPYIAWLDRITLRPRLLGALLFNTRWQQVLQTAALCLFFLASGRVDPRFRVL